MSKTNKNLLSFCNVRDCKSLDEFVSFYVPNIREKGQSSEFYVLLLNELFSAIADGNVKEFKKITLYLDYLNKVEEPCMLQRFFEDDRNRLNNSNLVILCCQFNQPEVLQLLFNNINNILNNSTVTLGRVLDPYTEDKMSKNVFYYAIRSQNLDLLNTLIDKWPENYFLNNLPELDDLLSSAYEELALRNVSLSKDVERFVMSKLTNIRFFLNSFKTKDCKGNKVSLDYILNRTNFLIEILTIFIEENTICQEISDKFLFLAKHVAHNIHILKRLLRSTYNRVPWEEMEFFLVSFVVANSTHEEINFFYLLILNKDRIIYHLKNFTETLKCVIGLIENEDPQKLGQLPTLGRDDVINQIMSSCPPFIDLYHDFEEIREMFSLERISKYLTLSLSVDPTEKEGKLVLSRTLQVIGEFVKNTLESPNLSTVTSQLLFSSLPSGTKSVLKDLRNSLSHGFSFSQRNMFEENGESNFFRNIQCDIKKIYDKVNSLSYRQKIKTITNIISDLYSVEDVNKIVYIVNLFKDFKIDESSFGSTKASTDFLEKINTLLKDLRSNAGETNVPFQKCLNELEKIIKNHAARNDIIKKEFLEGMILLKTLCTSLSTTSTNMSARAVEMRKIICKIFAAIKMNSNHRELPAIDLILKLKLEPFYNVNNLKVLVYEICYLIKFEGGNLKWIQALRDKFKEDFGPVDIGQKSILPPKKYYDEIKSHISSLKLILNKCKSHHKPVEHYNYILSDKKLLTVMEMLILDIMSMLDLTKYKLQNNIYFLDSNLPIVTGKVLRNHLAHYNALYGMVTDPSSHLIFNSEVLSQVDINEYKSKIGKVNILDVVALRGKFNKSLSIIDDQEELFCALEKGDLVSVKNCLKAGADIKGRNINFWTSLHFAAKSNSVETLEFVAKSDLNPNLKNDDGHTPLHIAAKNGQTENVKYLLLSKSNLINEVDGLGKTALHLAAEYGFFTVAAILVENKAKVNIHDVGGDSPLVYAVINNNIDIIDLLISKDKTIAQIGGVGLTLLHVAAEKGHIELVKRFLNETDVNARNDIDWTPLHAAATYGHKNVFITLIKNGADITATAINGYTALHYAAREGHEEIADILLQNKAKVNSTDVQRCTPLHLACRNGHEVLVNMLIKYNANLTITNTSGMTPLHCAVMGINFNTGPAIPIYNVEEKSIGFQEQTVQHKSSSCNKSVCELLIKHGADVNVQDINGCTPLHIAAELGKLSIAHCLLTSSALIDVENKYGLTQLHAAACSGNMKILELLIKHNSSINAQCKNVGTPLHLAAAKGHEDSVGLLLKCKADIYSKTSVGLSVLHAAIIGKKLGIVKLLIRNGADVNSNGPDNITPLTTAVESGQKDIVNILLANGAKVDGSNPTPLLVAIKESQCDIIKILIRNGANINIQNGAPLLVAVVLCSYDVVDILLKNKASVNLYADSDTTPLHLAAYGGNERIVQSLLSSGANVNALTRDFRDTPIFFAARMGFHEVIKILLCNGANLSIKSKDGSTPLHAASAFGHIEVVKILLEHGVKLDKDGENRTALELAVSYGHLDIVKSILQSRRVDLNSRGNLGYTLLHVASENGKLQIVEYLTDKGCNIYKANDRGSKAIHYASREGYKEIVDYFFKKGMSVNELGQEGQTVIHYAVAGGQFETTKFLIEKGADVNASDANNATPVHFATVVGNKQVLELLFKNGATFVPNLLFCNPEIPSIMHTEKLFELLKRTDSVKINIENYIHLGAFVNVKDDSFMTPLHYASKNGHGDALLILLKNMADPNSMDLDNFTPLHYAAKHSHLQLVLHLLSYGAIYNSTSASGIIPHALGTNKSIKGMLKLLNDSFEDLKLNKHNFIVELNKIKDINVLRAIMCAKNEKKLTLVEMAVCIRYSKIDKLKNIGQENINSDFHSAQQFHNQGNYQMALEIFESLWENRKIIFGSNSPATLELEVQIVIAIFQLGNYQKALHMIENVCKKYEEIFGLNFQETLSSKSLSALVLLNIGRNEEALGIFRDVFHRQMVLLGPKHSDTSETRFHMALVLNQLHFFEEALTINQELYEMRKSELGKNNALTVITQNNIALVLSNLKRFQEALKIYEEVYEKKTQIFGKQHKTSLSTLCNIAELLHQLGRTHEAYSFFQEVLNVQKNVLGVNNPDTLFTSCKLAEFFFEQGQLVRAYKLFREILEPYKTVFGINSDLVSNIHLRLDMISKCMGIQGYDPSLTINSLHGEEIMNAAISGDKFILNKLIMQGACVNFQDSGGRSPLHLAVSKGHLGAVSLLIQSGASIEHLTKKGNSLLHTASLNGHKEMILLLLKKVDRGKLPTFINAKTSIKGTTALHVAAERGSMDIVKILLEYGAQYNVHNKDNLMPVEVSKDKSVTNFLKLVDAAFDYAVKGHDGLIKEIQSLKLDDLKAVTSACNKEGKTLLQVTIQNKHKGIANQLLKLIKN